MNQLQKFRPLLAASIPDNETLERLHYPMIASPKVDGVRVLIHPELGPVTRSLKPVRNTFVRNLLYDPRFYGLDGEITCGPICAKDVFQRTTSGVMAESGSDEFVYWIFDDFLENEEPYTKRQASAIGRVYDAQATTGLSHVQSLPYRIVTSSSDVLQAEIEWLSQGFEGIMLRSPSGKYKFNRSTLKEEALLKLKRWTDDEATIYDFEPLESNQNPQTRDNLGLADRSDHKAGKVIVQTLGNLLVEHPRFGRFSTGSGLDESQRREIWSNREAYRGRVIKFKYQQVGIVDKPRFPIFLGFKGDE